MTGEPKQWWYCSFADDDRGGFRGAIFIQAESMIDAAIRAHTKGINPGGQMLAFAIPDSALPEERYRNKVLYKLELEQASGLLQTAEELFGNESD